VNVLDRLEQRYDQAVIRARKRWLMVDHVWLAAERFEEVLGSRLAAAISYYAFFAAFSLAVVAYSILRRFLNGANGAIIGTINNYLSQSLPWVRTTADSVGPGEVTTLGLIGLVLTGVAWVDALRSSSRAMWGLDQHPGHWIIRRLVDLGMLVVLGVLLASSLALTAAIDFALDQVAPHSGAFGPVLLRTSGPALEFVVNLILAGAVLVVVPRLRLSVRRLAPAALLVGVGIQLLNSVGRYYINRTATRPQYTLVIGAVGLLIYLYLLNQLILFGSAVAATSVKGSAADLATGKIDHLPTHDAGYATAAQSRPVDNLGEPRPPGGPDPR
jgi:membrane protein